MARETTQWTQTAKQRAARSWPKIPTVGPTWRFEVEYLVQSEAARLREQMREAGIEHEALLNLERKLDVQRVAGYVQTENLFYNCVAFHAEKTAAQHKNELNVAQQKSVESFVKQIRQSHPLSRQVLSRAGEVPADWQEVVRRSVQTD